MAATNSSSSFGGLLEDAGNLLYNTQLLVDRKASPAPGAKMHVPCSRCRSTAAVGASGAETRLGRIGVNICF